MIRTLIRILYIYIHYVLLAPAKYVIQFSWVNHAGSWNCCGQLQFSTRALYASSVQDITERSCKTLAVQSEFPLTLTGFRVALRLWFHSFGIWSWRQSLIEAAAHPEKHKGLAVMRRDMDLHHRWTALALHVHWHFSLGVLLLVPLRVELQSWAVQIAKKIKSRNQQMFVGRCGIFSRAVCP